MAANTYAVYPIALRLLGTRQEQLAGTPVNYYYYYYWIE